MRALVMSPPPLIFLLLGIARIMGVEVLPEEPHDVTPG